MNNKLMIPIIKLNPTPNKPLLISKIIPLDSMLSASASDVASTAFTITTVLGGTQVSITVGVPLITVGTLVMEPGITEVLVVYECEAPEPFVWVGFASVIVLISGNVLYEFEILPI